MTTTIRSQSFYGLLFPQLKKLLNGTEGNSVAVSRASKRHAVEKRMAKKVGLEHSDIIATAVEVADENGIESLNLRDVAARLGVRSPSLYHHVNGLKALRREVALYVANQLRDYLFDAIQSHKSRAALFALANAYREFAKKHPGSLAAMFPAPQPGEDDELYAALASVVTIFLDILAEDDIQGDTAIHAIRNLRSYLHGFVDLELRGGFGMPQNIEESFQNGLDIIINGLLSKGKSEI